MIIFIFIFVFIIIIALIVLVISNGKGNSKDNKKFTFQYKHNNHNNHNYSSLFPYTRSAPNKQENRYTPSVPNEQVRYTPSVPNEQVRYTPSVPNEQVRYTPLVPNEQENRYTPSIPNEQENRYTPTVPLNEQENRYTRSVPLNELISESNQKTESNIHNCEDNYIWNKYLKKCMTTECPMETYLNCRNKGWVLPYQIIAPNPNPNVDVPTNVYTANMGGLSPSSVEKICEQLNIPVPEEGEVCWSECQHRYTKMECPEMTMEECTAITPGYGYNDSPQAMTTFLNPGLFTRGETCGYISRFTPEYQLKTLFWDTGIKNAVLPGEICWSAACQKCVKPKPLTREQHHIKHNQNPLCFPNNQTCQRDVKFDAIVLPPSTGIIPVRQLSSETCQEWSTFTEWSEYNLNPAVLPGEVCWNPCGGGCVAPRDW
jgi:hypothetical protein